MSEPQQLERWIINVLVNKRCTKQKTWLSLSQCFLSGEESYSKAADSSVEQGLSKQMSNHNVWLTRAVCLAVGSERDKERLGMLLMDHLHRSLRMQLSVLVGRCADCWRFGPRRLQCLHGIHVVVTIQDFLATVTTTVLPQYICNTCKSHTTALVFTTEQVNGGRWLGKVSVILYH